MLGTFEFSEADINKFLVTFSEPVISASPSNGNICIVLVKVLPSPLVKVILFLFNLFFSYYT